ncbi:MAG: glycosyltransferase [Flavobacteriia bacterium]|nr:glycosyltransferase [Flavobacteriia bacterium]
MSEKSKSKKLKVLFLNSWYPNIYNETLGNFCEKHIETLMPFVEIISFSVFSHINLKKISINENSGKLYPSYTAYFPKNKGIFKHLIHLIRFIKVVRIFNQKFPFKQFDLVHVNVAYPLGILAFYIKKKYGIPFVITEHSTEYSKHPLNFSFFKKFLILKIFNNANEIFPVSTDLKINLCKIGIKNNFFCIPNVVNTDIFQLKTQNNTHFKRFIHISTANEEQKNVSGIIKVFLKISKTFPDIHLTILSDGKLDYLKELTKKNEKENFTFIGKSSINEIAMELVKNDALILFSNYENFPCVIPEAFSCGLPVISTNVNGIPEYVNSENGILIQAKDEKALEKTVVNLYNGEIDFNSSEIRNFALKHFSYPSIGNAFYSRYKNILNVS